MDARLKFLLAMLVTTGFLAVVIGVAVGVFGIKDNPAVLMLFGGLSSNFGTIVAYYFGSSQGSEAKSQMLADKIPDRPAPAPAAAPVPNPPNVPLQK